MSQEPIQSPRPTRLLGLRFLAAHVGLGRHRVGEGGSTARFRSKKETPRNRASGTLIIFPEIIGVTAAAPMTPILLWKLLAAGHAIWAGGGLVCWIGAVYFAARLILRRQYAIALIPMLVIAGLCLLLVRVVPK